MTDQFDELLRKNKEWVNRIKEDEPNFFENLAKGQKPEFLWIGCSDSRVPASQITGTLPGSLFVHRNIANMVVHTDSNLLSVVYYGVKYLKIKRIIVCGHYGCGGIQAAMENSSHGYIDDWLCFAKDAYWKNREELDAISDQKAREDRFVELNVKEQVQNLARLSIIQDEWRSDTYPIISGWVYSLKDGILNEVVERFRGYENLDPVFRYTFNES